MTLLMDGAEDWEHPRLSQLLRSIASRKRPRQSQYGEWPGPADMRKAIARRRAGLPAPPISSSSPNAGAAPAILTFAEFTKFAPATQPASAELKKKFKQFMELAESLTSSSSAGDLLFGMGATRTKKEVRIAKM